MAHKNSLKLVQQKKLEVVFSGKKTKHTTLLFLNIVKVSHISVQKPHGPVIAVYLNFDDYIKETTVIVGYG